jgi:hypothetical protein
MNVNLKLKTIQEILNIKDIKTNNFYIPSYQRGYRWEEQQVKDLLNDIYEFANRKKVQNEFYCLQPIVVLYNNINNRYKVLDGQQRLTTIYIIFKYLQNLQIEFEDLKKECSKIQNFFDIDSFNVEALYTITYETREKDKSSKTFLDEHLQDELNYSNPDFYYMSSAYTTIKEWFKNKNKKLFLDTLLNDTKVIWYEVQATTEKEEIDIFTRLNMGKISLTNAELIKAMLLIPIEDYKEQIEFSTIWDKMELTLQNDEFWYFLSNDKKATTTIDLIFNTLAQKYNEEFNLNISKQDDKFSFYVFDRVLKEDFKTAKEIWDDSQEIYRYFIDWHNDRDMYHKIGYLINFKLTSLVDLLKEYEGKTKDKFKKYLDTSIKLEINLQQLIFKDKEKIKKILLLFNLETILQNDKSNQKFQFDKYKNESWDIEHIASQTDNINKEEWVKTIFKYIKNRDIKFTKKILENRYECIYKIVKEEFKIKELDDNLKDNIGNLTLLNSKINRSYGNAFFPVKRAIILKEDSGGSFIPISTKNIFLKQYSKKLSDMMNWSSNDMDDYRVEIYNLLEKYGVKDIKVKDESIRK